MISSLRKLIIFEKVGTAAIETVINGGGELGVNWVGDEEVVVVDGVGEGLIWGNVPSKLVMHHAIVFISSTFETRDEILPNVSIVPCFKIARRFGWLCEAMLPRHMMI